MNNNKLCENKKWELVNFCEFDKYAEKSYCAIHNVDSSKNLGDITKVDEENLSPFNMICGGSPCFVAGTKVITKEGYKNIENIKTGDMVLTHKNRFMPVLKTGGDTNKDIYKLKVQGFLETECTDYHPFYCNSIVVDVLYYIFIELYKAMPYLFDDLRLSSFFSGIGAFECALDRLYESINKIEKRLG